MVAAMKYLSKRDQGIVMKEAVNDFWVEETQQKKELLLTAEAFQIKPEYWKKGSDYKIWLIVIEYREIVQRNHKDLLKQICRNDEILKVIEVQVNGRTRLDEILEVRWYDFIWIWRIEYCSLCIEVLLQLPKDNVVKISYR